MNDQNNFEWKNKSAVFLNRKFWRVKLSHSYMRQLYQVIDYINWLATPYTNKQLFFNLLQYYNSLYPNLSCLDIFMIKWWWVNSQWRNLTLVRRFWTTNIYLWGSKISKICLFGFPTSRANFWNANFENYFKYFLIK